MNTLIQFGLIVVVLKKNLTMKYTKFLIYSLAVLIHSCIDQVASYDCDLGCDLSPLVNGNPVCGTDLVIYMNECFAFCQGVTITNAEYCRTGTNSESNLNEELTPEDVGEGDASAVETTGFVRFSILNRFKMESFNLRRKLDPTKLVDTTVINEPNGSVTTDSNNNTIAGIQYEAIRLTSDGYEYVKPVGGMLQSRYDAKKHANINHKSYDGFIPEARRQRRHLREETNTTRRDLIVIGADTRSRIMDTTIYPYSIITSIAYSTCNSCCSGTVIYTDAVLTAAHCLYDTGKKRWETHTYATPGHFSADYEPFGRWYVDYMTVYNMYKEDDSWSYDIGVVVYKVNSAGNSIGNVVGYAGLSVTDAVTASFDQSFQGSTITGYPSDKPDGQMWTSGTCNGGFSVVSSVNTLQYACDTYAGMSGSSVLDANNYVRGVHVYGDPNWKVNGATALLSSNEHAASIVEWAGISEVPVSNSPTLGPVAPTTIDAPIPVGVAPIPIVAPSPVRSPPTPPSSDDRCPCPEDAYFCCLIYSIFKALFGI